MGRKQCLSIILTALIILSLSGCAQLEKRGPVDPDVSMFELYVSDNEMVEIEDPVFSKGDTVFFTLQYKSAENFKPLEASNIEYEFSRLRPVNMDVHEGFPVDSMTFLDRKGNTERSVTLDPGESALLQMTIPTTQEKWDQIMEETGSNKSVAFELVIKMNDLVVPLHSNELTINV